MRRPSSPIAHRSSLRATLVFAAIAVLTLAAYWPSFSVPFQFDDYGAIVENANERAAAGLGGLNWLGMGSRVLPAATFQLNFRFGRDDPTGYHAVNFAVHLLASLAVFQLALALCAAPRLRDSAPARHRLAFAAAATLLFACHPLQTQAVTYIVQRMASMAAMFYLWCVVFYVRARTVQEAGGRPLLLFAAAALAALAAFFSKENAVSLPLAIVLTEVVFFGGLTLDRVLRLFPLALLAAAVPVGWRLWLGWQQLPEGESLSTLEKIATITAQTFTSAEVATGVPALNYFLTQAVVVPRYLGLTILPVGLNVDHDVALVRQPDLAVLAGFVFLAALAGVGLALWRRRPVVSFGLLWIFVALSIESSFLPINDVMMEHRMYLAMPGVALIAARAFVWLRQRAPSAALAVALGAALLFPSLTYARNLVWRSPVSLWADAVRKSPNKARTQLNAGVAYHIAGQLDDAVRHYCRALALHPSQGIAEIADENLEIVLEQQGRLDEVMRELMAVNPVEVGPDGSVQVEYDLAKVVCR